MISQSNTYNEVSNSFRLVTRGTFLGINLDLWIALFCISIAIFVFSFTLFGKYIRAIEENELILVEAGINIKFVKLLCYVFGSFFYSIATILLISKQGSTSSTNGIGLEITSIAAIFIGGVLSARRNVHGNDIRFFGLIIGVFILAIIENGILFISVNQYVKDVIIGVLFVWSITVKKKSKE